MCIKWLFWTQWEVENHFKALYVRGTEDSDFIWNQNLPFSGVCPNPVSCLFEGHQLERGPEAACEPGEGCLQRCGHLLLWRPPQCCGRARWKAHLWTRHRASRHSQEKSNFIYFSFLINPIMDGESHKSTSGFLDGVSFLYFFFF